MPEAIIHSDFLMNTTVEQYILGSRDKSLAHRTAAEIKKLEQTMSFFIAQSEVSCINANAGLQFVQVCPELHLLLQAAHTYSSLSKGAFDLASGPLINLWRTSLGKGMIPAEGEIQEKMKFSGYRYLKIKKDGRVKLKKKNCLIDLGAAGKGYAADYCIDFYKNAGIDCAFINFGGNVKAIGKKTCGENWRVGIQDPLRPRGKLLGAVSVSDMSVVTSGGYERFHCVNGKPFHHIIDPRTGYPSDSGILSATVLYENSLAADAISTAVFVLGLEKGIALIKKIDGMSAILVTSKKEVYITPDVKTRFTPALNASGYALKII